MNEAKRAKQAARIGGLPALAGIGGVLLAGCVSSPDTSRLARLEARVAALERRASAVETAGADMTNRLEALGSRLEYLTSEQAEQRGTLDRLQEKAPVAGERK